MDQFQQQVSAHAINREVCFLHMKSTQHIYSGFEYIAYLFILEM